MRSILASCVSGGPIERLAKRLEAQGSPARLSAAYTPERWRALMCTVGGRLAARLGAMILFPLRALADAVAGGPAVLVPTTNPFFLPFLLVATRPAHRCPVVPLIYDLFPDALEVSGLANPSGPLARLGSWANRFVFSRADAVVFIGERMGAHARRRYGEPVRWRVLETGADLSEFAPEALGPSEPHGDLERWCAGRVVLSYVGNMGRMHDWETLAAAIPRVVAEAGNRVGVVVAASGPGVEQLRRAWAGLPGGAVRFEPPLADRPWVRLLVRTQVALVTLREEARNTSIPSKIFSAMAASNAVLAVAPRDSDVADLVLRHGCGVLVRPGDDGAAASEILRFVRDAEHLERLRRNARAAVEAHYDMPRLAERWAALFREVTPRRSLPPGSP